MSRLRADRFIWRTGAAAISAVASAAAGVLTALVTAHPSTGLWVALTVLVIIWATLQAVVVAGERHSARRTPNDHLQRLEAVDDGHGVTQIARDEIKASSEQLPSRPAREERPDILRGEPTLISRTTHQNNTAEIANLDRCLATLGVPKLDLPDVAVWIVQYLDNPASAPKPPGDHWPMRVRRSFAEFLANLELFAAPEPLLENCFYMSVSKLARTYQAHRRELGDEPDPANRFRLLYHYFARTKRLAFAPSLILLGEPLPTDGNTWLYFTGEFMLVLNDSQLETQIHDLIEDAGGRDNSYLTHQIFQSSDPFFLPIISFRGMIGTHPVAIQMSRKYMAVESHTFTALSSALIGEPVSLTGLGTLLGGELQPIVCRLMKGDLRYA